MEPFSFVVHYEEADAVELNWTGPKPPREQRSWRKVPYKWRLALYAVAVAMGVALLASGRPAGVAWWLLLAATAFLGFFVLLYLLYLVVGRKAQKENIARLVDGHDCVVRVDDAGIRSARADNAEENFWAWELFTLVTVTPRLYLVTVGDRQRIVLPRRNLAEHEAALDAYVAAKLEPRGVRVYRYGAAPVKE